MSPPLPHPLLARESRVTDFFRGLSLPLQAIRLVFGERKLFRLALVASAVTLAALVALVILLGTYTDDLVRRFMFTPQTWYGEVGFWSLVVLLFLLLLAVGLNTVPLLLLAPLQDPLSEATEALCGEFEPPRFSIAGLLRGAWVALGHTLARVALLLAGHAVLLPLNLLPGYGNLAWTVLSITWTIYWLAAEYLDAAMARHLYRFRDVRQAVWARLPLSLGFGSAIYLLLWVPVLNLFFIPVAVVAGTLLFRSLRAVGAIPPPPGTR